MNCLIENGESINNSNHISNIFNTYFANVGKSIDNCIGKSTLDPLFFMNDSSNPQSFFISPVIPQEVSGIISSLDRSKTVGPYSIPIKLLKILGSRISTHLSQIINSSFSSGTFPDVLKIAKITPIFKKGSKTDKNNYRPISVLSVFSKIFEKLMYTRLYKYLDVHNILCSQQYGFRANHSTSHALISITEEIKVHITLTGFSNVHIERS